MGCRLSKLRSFDPYLGRGLANLLTALRGDHRLATRDQRLKRVRRVRTNDVSVNDDTVFSNALRQRICRTTIYQAGIAILVRSASYSVYRILAVNERINTINGRLRVVKLTDNAGRLFFYEVTKGVVDRRFRFTQFVEGVRPRRTVTALRDGKILAFRDATFVDDGFPLFTVALSISRRFNAKVTNMGGGQDVLPFPTQPHPIQGSVRNVYLLIP